MTVFMCNNAVNWEHLINEVYLTLLQSRKQVFLLWTKTRALLCSWRNWKVHCVEVLQLHSVTAWVAE